MANTSYIVENRLAREAQRSRRTALTVGFPLALIVAAFFYFLFPQLPFWWLLLIVGIICLGISQSAGSILQAGARGEDAALEVLSLLPDSYYLFNQIEVPDPKSKTGLTEIDFVVVGPNGIFIVEVKNNRGQIFGSEQQKHWMVRKVGRRGTPYRSKMSNPIRQVKRQIWVLKNYFRDNGLNPWLNGTLFFTHPDCSLKIAEEVSIPIFDDDYDIIDFIETYNPKRQVCDQPKVVGTLAGLRITDG